MTDYSRIKMVPIGHKVEDLPGLYQDLKSAFFNVVNVAVDERGTYLYMDVAERKDPRPIVQRWVNRPLRIQKPTTSFLMRMLRKIW